MAGTFQEGLANLGQFMTSPQMPVLAGQLGAGIMAPYAQNDPKAAVIGNIGNIAANYGKSAIAAGEATAQNQKANELQQWLKTLLPTLIAGGGMTADPLKGVNEVKIDNTGQAVLKMNLQNQGNNGPAGATDPSQPATPNTGQAVSPAPQLQQPQGFNPRLLPF